MVTVLTERGVVEGVEGDGSGDALWISTSEVEGATGWALKPEGLCLNDLCTPVPPGHESQFVRDDSHGDGAVNVAAFWRRMERPALHDGTGSVWMLGEPASSRAAQLESLQAPDFTLPDLDGKLHSLSDHRGKKVFLTTWASW
jgi:hypothetical protein